MELIHVQHLRDGTEEVRLEATRVLARIGDEQAVQPLIEALRNDSADSVRKGAADALGSFGMKDFFPSAIDPLIEALKDDYANVRRSAVGALGKIGNERAVEPLIEALRDDSADVVRMLAAIALGRIGDERAVEPLIEALTDGRERVRSAAAHALGLISDERAIKPLIEALKDDCANVRCGAAGAFQSFGESYGDDEPLPIPMLSDAFEPLIEALRDGSADVRRFAAWSLIWVGGMRAIGPLTELQLGDKDRWVRVVAKEAIEELESYLQDSSKASD